MRPSFKLIAASASLFAVMAGPAALTVTAHELDTEIGAGAYRDTSEERAHARGLLHLHGEVRGLHEDRMHHHPAHRNHGADLSASETASVQSVARVKQSSIITAIRARMEAMITTAEAHKAAAEARSSEKKDARESIRGNFRASLKTTIEDFVISIKTILGITIDS